MPPQCTEGNDFNGNLGLRVSSIFVILVGSALGTLLPIYAARRSTRNMLKGRERVAFFAKYFGSGVILATALIHLLAPAFDALGNECLGSVTDYPWPAAIVLVSWFCIFIIHVLAARLEKDKSKGDALNDRRDSAVVGSSSKVVAEPPVDKYHDDPPPAEEPTGNTQQTTSIEQSLKPQEPHLDAHDLVENGRNSNLDFNPDSYAAQMTGLFILESGIVSHSVFIGLALACAGNEFVTLYIVLTLHQTFEGIGLGARLGSIDWPKSKRWTPYVLALGYALSTPIAIAVGLGVRTTFSPGSRTSLMVNGIFDSISAGILTYTSLVELVAHDFLFSPTMRDAPLKVVFSAISAMALGALLMAILGNWA